MEKVWRFLLESYPDDLGANLLRLISQNAELEKTICSTQPTTEIAKTLLNQKGMFSSDRTEEKIAALKLLLRKKEVLEIFLLTRNPNEEVVFEALKNLNPENLADDQLFTRHLSQWRVVFWGNMLRSMANVF